MTFIQKIDLNYREKYFSTDIEDITNLPDVVLDSKLVWQEEIERIFQGVYHYKNPSATIRIKFNYKKGSCELDIFCGKEERNQIKKDLTEKLGIKFKDGKKS